MKKNTIILIVVLALLAAAVITIVVLKANANKKEALAAADTLVQDSVVQEIGQDTSISDTTVEQTVADTVVEVAEPEVKEEPQVTQNQPSSQTIAEETPTAAADPISRAIATGRPVLADFGRGTCIPCKKMAPILAELKEEYAGKAEILVLDIDEYMELTRSVGIRMIPTQIFYDSKGSEVTRHVGFMDKQAIIAQFQAMGVTGVD